MPNGEIITSTHTALLYHQDLPLQAWKLHLFPGLNKALLSIGTLRYHVCEANFNDKSILIFNKWSGNFIIKGTRDPCTNLYMLNLTQQKKLMTESTTPDEYFSGSAYECKSKITLVDYHHASFWIPTQSGWGKAITQKLIRFLARPIIWPGAQTFIQKTINHTWEPSATSKRPQINTGKGDLPCYIKQQAVHPLPIQMPNG